MTSFISSHEHHTPCSHDGDGPPVQFAFWANATVDDGVNLELHFILQRPHTQKAQMRTGMSLHSDRKQHC